MVPRFPRRILAFVAALTLSPLPIGCGGGEGTSAGDITDVKHTDVERQSIGNCWLYAEASWIESMHLSATGKSFDVSQSYWTYWHWYEQIVNAGVSEIETGGNFWAASDIILDRGIMPEASFVKEDATSEMSSRQSQALSTINHELRSGRLKEASSRDNPELVRKVLDEAWALTPAVKGQLTKAFGKDGSKTLRLGGTTKGTAIEAAYEFKVQYTERRSNPDVPTTKSTTLDVAINEWNFEQYPSWGDDVEKREFLRSVQKALHDSQPVVLTWDVDFNAMEHRDPERRGSFNLETLKAAGPGQQGGHMVVLEDYEAETEEFGVLRAGVTLDPNNPEDKLKLDAALRPSTTVKLLRIKNSWGALRDDRSSVPGFPGYHDLYMDYLNGPIAWCPSVSGSKNSTNCTGLSKPLRSVVLPPGY